MTLRSAILRLAGIASPRSSIIPAASSYAGPSPFNTLFGSWGGTGELRLDKGRKERIKCSAYYTGGGSELGMAIRCQSDSYKIEIRSKLSYSGGRLSGNWEERTFNASGAASGTATPSSIRLSISGAVSGSMNVTYTKTTPKRLYLYARRCFAGREHYAWPKLTLPFAPGRPHRPLPSVRCGVSMSGRDRHQCGGAYDEQRVFADGEVRGWQA